MLQAEAGLTGGARFRVAGVFERDRHHAARTLGGQADDAAFGEAINGVEQSGVQSGSV